MYWYIPDLVVIYKQFCCSYQLLGRPRYAALTALQVMGTAIENTCISFNTQKFLRGSPFAIKGRGWYKSLVGTRVWWPLADFLL